MNPFMTPLIADLDGPMGRTTVGACLEMSGSTNLVSAGRPYPAEP
jgi:hypothetical protein